MNRPTFPEIALELGITPKEAENAFFNGLRKLRRDYPETLRIMYGMLGDIHHSEIFSNEGVD